MKKFHTYLYGWKFTLVTDHKPLITILGPKRGVPAVAAARLQQWALLLEFRSTTDHGNADALLRLSLLEEGTRAPSETQLCNLRKIEALPVTSQEIKVATQRAPVLSHTF